ncbi:DUF1440 domain-containing protein [Novosphingobium sp. 9U]|uniref:DUF1440 domain-containing protein n=1 Tax=Novosphingobium sp. 9U TaxID=2653158 RepID=UPI0012F0B6AD|nr:DUF1440 domain-containing protein [Novosphingobium sp. 9U]VWX53134.1 conserved hypothetical protein [Novosphingobium sp. 9U]
MLLETSTGETLTQPRPAVDTAVEIADGAAAGALAGLAGAAVMEVFQTYSAALFQPSGSKPPATEQAALSAARLAGAARLRRADRQAGGQAVHYVTGTLAGAAYGALAETAPGVTRWRGLAFGLACATLIDQIAVPLAGFARQPLRYTLRTHLYGLASHAVFGLVTEAVRKGLRRRPPIAVLDSKGERSGVTMEDVSVPLFLGLANGQRTFTPPAAVTVAAASSGLGLAGTPLSFLASKWTGAIMSAAAIGEYIADKQPGIPARIAPSALAGRAIGGALSGAAAARPGRALLAAGIGAAGALAGAYISYKARAALAKAIGRDAPVAFAEDALSLLGSAALAGYAALRENQRQTRQDLPIAA